MLLAKLNGQLVEPTPGLKAICPNCGEIVVSKCGNINIWHWSHLKDTDCDPWSEEETEWHKNWKSWFPIENREVVIKPHRADVYWCGKVIEFQHSQISVDEMNERENFYKNMIWVVDCSAFLFNMDFRSNNFCRWKWMHKVWDYSMMPIYFDTGSDIYLAVKFYSKGFLYKKISRTDFLRQYLNVNINRNPAFGGK